MDAVFATRMLAAWDDGQRLPLPSRALAMLAAGVDDLAPAALAGMPVGERDRLLMDLRHQLVGSQVMGLVRCPHCQEMIEVEFALPQIRQPASGDARTGWVETGRCRMHVRAPTAGDLVAVAGLRDPQVIRRQLFERCVLAAWQDNEPVAPALLPDGAIVAAARRMAELDPQGDVELGLDCPSCGNASRRVFDIAWCLWQELEVWAARLLGDVHELARGYGWAERDILALSPARRRHYLALLGR